MDKKIVFGAVGFAVIVCVLASVYVASFMAPAQTPLTPTDEMDFSVGGSSDCLRFLNTTVPTFYVPFTVAANQNWQLTVNASKMPGGVNGWTDVYIYRGYWDGGANHTCKAGDLYPIINDIESADFAIKAGQPYTQTFGGSTQESYTVFFVVPPGGPSSFHVTYKPA